MRLSSLFGTSLLVLAMSGSGALAQNSQPYIALATSSYGAMSCGQFAALSGGERDAIVRKMIAMAPGSSLTATNNASQGITTSGEVIQEEAQSTLPPLDSGRLMSACQAVNTSSTLRDAFAHSNLPQGSDFISGN